MRIRWTPAAAADLERLSNYLKRPPSVAELVSGQPLATRGERRAITTLIFF
jgi:hypothetical protein